jgi:uncharacterized integral membrane protein (TIGR00698 family)
VALSTGIARAGGAQMGERAPGLILSAALALAAMALARIPALADAAVSPLVIAILLGIAAGNLPRQPVAALPGAGFNLVRGPLLRLAIVLYGFRVTLGEMQAVGGGAVLASAIMVTSTLLLAWYAGRRWLGLDRDSALLIGAGSAICGAAAVLASEGVIRSRGASVGVAVATVVVFGTAAMFLYPVLVPALMQIVGLDWAAVAQGVYAGSTIHEVAQVLVAGSALGPEAAHAALVTKMMRVCMLAPFLLVLSFAWARGGGEAAGGVRMPWFAVAFLALIVIHPWLGLSPATLEAIAVADTALLATAMAALGMSVRVAAIRAAGARPLLLGLLLFAWLIGGGLVVNMLVAGS